MQARNFFRLEPNKALRIYDLLVAAGWLKGTAPPAGPCAAQPTSSNVSKDTADPAGHPRAGYHHADMQAGGEASDSGFGTGGDVAGGVGLYGQQAHGGVADGHTADNDGDDGDDDMGSESGSGHEAVGPVAAVQIKEEQ